MKPPQFFLTIVLKKKKDLLSFSVYGCLHACVFVHYMRVWLGYGSPELDGCELFCRGWESNPTPLRE